MWPTLVLFVAFVIVGYGITKPEIVNALTGGVLTRSVSIYLHTVLTAPVLILIMIHVLIDVKLALDRRGVGYGRLADALLITLGIITSAVIVLLQVLI